MKIPITDTFLGEILNAASKTEDALRLLIHQPKSLGQICLPVDSPIYQKYYKVLHPQKFSRLLYHLKKNNYIKAANLKNKKAIVLTRKGLSKAFKASFRLGDNVKRKDGKWITVIFDIPQKHNKARGLLRSVLENLGYKMFQQSVWVTPYDVAEKTENLLQHYSLDNYVKTFLIEKL